MKKRRNGLCAAVLLLSAGVVSLYAQPQFPGAPFTRGQDVSPTFEGWEGNPDGTSTLYFGYYNRNSEEEIDVPLGPDNTFDLGNGDQGQPTHFYPRRRWFVFKVVVPKDWPKDKRVVWTLTTKGKTNQAKGWLQSEWEVDQMLISRNAGADPFLRASNSNISPGNKAPVVKGGPAQTITLPAAATLTATATDDGIPGSEVGGRRATRRPGPVDLISWSRQGSIRSRLEPRGLRKTRHIGDEGEFQHARCLPAPSDRHGRLVVLDLRRGRAGEPGHIRRERALTGL